MAAESRLESSDLTPVHGAGDDAAPASETVFLGPPPAPAAVAGRLAELQQLLHEEPHSFGFFQAVRLLERLAPDRARVGEFEDPATEVVRFGVPPTLAFPASEIQQLVPAPDAPTTLRVNFLGLTGPQGVLPHAYTLLAQERLRQRDAALTDFLDLFHHRLISLFYRAWRKFRFTVAREDDAADRLGEHLLDLIGLGIAGTRNRLPVTDEVLGGRAGVLAAQPRGAASLQWLVEDYFQVPVGIEQFVGGWYAVPDEERCAVGGDAAPANRLGAALVGDEIWDAQARVRVRLGPLPRAQYDAFLPGGAAHRELAALLRFYSHDQFDFEVQLVLAADDVPGVRPGADDVEPRLGWTSWIRTGPRTRAGDETILTLHSEAAS
jgi:type VI secretion system protein ImpH